MVCVGESPVAVTGQSGPSINLHWSQFSNGPNQMILAGGPTAVGSLAVQSSSLQAVMLVHGDSRGSNGSEHGEHMVTEPDLAESQSGFHNLCCI